MPRQPGVDDEVFSLFAEDSRALVYVPIDAAVVVLGDRRKPQDPICRALRPWPA